MASDVIPKKRINIELPEIIIDRLDNIASQMNFSRSELIISEKIAEKEKESLEQSMREGYPANYDFIKESSSEWDFTLKDGA